jgi:hypothetical protein
MAKATITIGDRLVGFADYGPSDVVVKQVVPAVVELLGPDG